MKVMIIVDLNFESQNQVEKLNRCLAKNKIKSYFKPLVIPIKEDRK